MKLLELHLERVRGRVDARDALTIVREDTHQDGEVGLQHVVHTLLPQREVVDVVQLDALPALEPHAVVLHRLPLDRHRVAPHVEARRDNVRVGRHDLLLVQLADDVLDHALHALRGGHLPHRLVLAHAAPRNRLAHLVVVERGHVGARGGGAELGLVLVHTGRHLVEPLGVDKGHLGLGQREARLDLVAAPLVARDVGRLRNLPVAHHLLCLEQILPLVPVDAALLALGLGVGGDLVPPLLEFGLEGGEDGLHVLVAGEHLLEEVRVVALGVGKHDLVQHGAQALGVVDDIRRDDELVLGVLGLLARRGRAEPKVRVGAPEGDANEQLDELVQHELDVRLLVALRLLARLGRLLPALLRRVRRAILVGALLLLLLGRLGRRGASVGLLEHVGHHVELEVLCLEPDILHEVLELAHRHLDRILGGARAADGLGVVREDGDEVREALLQQVMHILLPSGEVEHIP
mmetsp:Transcript_32753/g.74003  ORF Transcript_32753/g.74003 Transcript_32753/m.74003 type:complete len:463 (-) Transcript_32753:1199-2587(-)